MISEITSSQSQERVRFTVQDCTFKLGVQTVTEASKFEDWKTFRQILEDRLPYNSRETRKRYCSYLRKWALDNGDFSCLAIRFWKSYNDADFLLQLLRERYLAAFPMLGKFVAITLSKVPVGTPVDLQIFKGFLNSEGSTVTADTAQKLRANMRDLGFLRNAGAKITVVNSMTLPQTVFLVLLHHYFASMPTTIPVSDILVHPFWRHLGGREESEVRSALSMAAAKDLLARYAIVDHLEQVTTRFTLEEFLRRGVRM